ncbi:MAG: FAD-linked oxidase C-terminal domain-containing protein [Candidatus Zhuqueibacterota bacterium]
MDELLKQLNHIVGQDYVISPDKPEYFAYTFGDATMYRSKPEVIVYPGAVEEIQQIVKLANEKKIAVTTSAGLTGLSGGAIAQKGILLNVSRLRRIVAVDEVSKTVTVEPGVSCAKLNDYLAQYRLIIPVAPASHLISTLGANIAEASGGTFGMSKGTFKNYLLTLNVVDGQGNLFQTGRPFPKQSTGPDLTALFLGSEGTMGIITEMTFRCDYLPEDTWTIRCQFEDESALQAIHEGLAREKIELFSFEYMDDKIMKCLGKEHMLLLLQTAGSKQCSKINAEKVVALLEKLHPIELKYTNDPKEADVLYTERRSALGALAKADPNKPVIVQFDPVLPLHKFNEGVKKMRELAARENLELIIYGHAGDGNLHPSFIVEDDIEQKKKARKVIREFDVWIEKEGGVYAGEHAVGFFLGRGQDFIRPEVGRYLSAIKDTFDPNHVLNPGKIVHIEEPSLELEPVKEQYKPIAAICSLCAKCHLCKNDSPKFAQMPFEHNTIRGRIAMIDSATRGKIPFDEIKPFVAEMEPWTKGMNCPTFIKNRMGELISLSLSEV